MVVLSIEDIEFEEKKDSVRAHFIKRYYFDLDKSSLKNIGDYRIKKGNIEFEEKSKRTVSNKLSLLISQGFENLKNKLYDKPTTYITRGDIPLIGSGAFGLIDRGTNLVEAKPNTGCNMNCVYCSVNEGKNNKVRDVVISPDYLAEEIRRVAEVKEHKVEVHINPQGEPLLYPKLEEFIKNLKNLERIKFVSMNTNGVLLTEERIDELNEAGLDRLNVSMDGATKDVVDELSRINYPLERVKKMIRYADKKMEVLLAPVILPGVNEEEVEPLLELSEELDSDHPTTGFQNYLEYSRGRKPEGVEPRSMEDFFDFLEEKGLSREEVRRDAEEFGVYEDNSLKKPFKKGDVVEVTVKMPGRTEGQSIGEAQNRAVTIFSEEVVGSRVKVEIVRDKHNIFLGKKV